MEALRSSPKHSLVMCLAACYQVNHKLVITTFAQKDAMLPILKTNSQIITLPWGRRKNENGRLPVGGWIAQKTYKLGKYDRFFPKLVKLPILKFLENDIEGQGLWFDITGGHFIQGLYLQEKEERRIYVMTIIPAIPDTVFSRWPKIICTDKVLA